MDSTPSLLLWLAYIVTAACLVWYFIVAAVKGRPAKAALAQAAENARHQQERDDELKECRRTELARTDLDDSGKHSTPVHVVRGVDRRKGERRKTGKRK